MGRFEIEECIRHLDFIVQGTMEKINENLTISTKHTLEHKDQDTVEFVVSQIETLSISFYFDYNKCFDWQIRTYKLCNTNELCAIEGGS